VLAETSAPESSMAGFWLALPATRSDMGFARRRSAETCAEERVSDRRPQPKPVAVTPRPLCNQERQLRDLKPQAHLCPMGFPLLPRSSSPAAGLGCPRTWAIPLLFGAACSQGRHCPGDAVSLSDTRGPGPPEGLGATWRQPPHPSPHLLGLPPQHYLLLPLLRLQSPDLKLHKRERSTPGVPPGHPSDGRSAGAPTTSAWSSYSGVTSLTSDSNSPQVSSRGLAPMAHRPPSPAGS